MEVKLNEALQLRKSGALLASNQLLRSLIEEEPNDPYLNYQVAWSFDVLEKEAEAIPYYEKAIEYGLKGTDLQGAYLGLGSTYRALGSYEQAEKVFQRGIKAFPSDNALKVFYAMVLYNLKRYSEGMGILLKLLAMTSNDQDIVDYQRAIAFYADKLDSTFE